MSPDLLSNLSPKFNPHQTSPQSLPSLVYFTSKFVYSFVYFTPKLLIYPKAYLLHR